MFEQIVESLKQKFPNVDIDSAVKQAEEALRGADLSNPGDILKNQGMTIDAVDGIYNKYGNSKPGRMVLAMMGTSPDKLRNQAIQFLNGNKPNSGASTGNRKGTTNNNSNGRTRFPKLK